MTEGHCKPNMSNKIENIVTPPGQQDVQEAANGCLQVSSHGSSSNNHKTTEEGVPSSAASTGDATAEKNMGAGASACYVTPESGQAVQVGSMKARMLEEKLRASSNST